MSEQVRINRNIVFAGVANNTPNIEGNLNPDRKSVFYDYTELALDNTNKYTPFLDTTSAIALASGGITLTTAATDNKVCSQSQGGIWWYPAKNPVVEMRFQVDVVTTLAVFCGFSDAVSEAAATMPFALATATLTDTCTNGVGWLFDIDQTLDYWNAVNTNGGTQAFTQMGSTYIPVAATDVTLRTELDSSGNARFYYNGVEKHYKASAVSSTTPLVPYFGIKNMAAAAHVATLKYVHAWQDV